MHIFDMKCFNKKGSQTVTEQAKEPPRKIKNVICIYMCIHIYIVYIYIDMHIYIIYRYE